jgi:MFS family permease
VNKSKKILFFSIGFNMPYVYLAAQAEELGIDKKSASLLISTIGATNTVGRIILGYISDKPWVNRLHIYNACLTICGIATVVCAFCFEFWGLAGYAAVFGFTIGNFVSKIILKH